MYCSSFFCLFVFEAVKVFLGEWPIYWWHSRRTLNCQSISVVNAEITIQIHLRNEFGNKDKSKETNAKNMWYCVALSVVLPLGVLFLILITYRCTAQMHWNVDSHKMTLDFWRMLLQKQEYNSWACFDQTKTALAFLTGAGLYDKYYNIFLIFEACNPFVLVKIICLWTYIDIMISHSHFWFFHELFLFCML